MMAKKTKRKLTAYKPSTPEEHRAVGMYRNEQRMMLTRAPEGGAELYGRHYGPGEFLPFYIPRAAMPQVDGQDIPALLVFLRKAGMSSDYRLIDPADLIRPHQRVEERLVKSIDEALLNKPILVSADLYIIDGHHRWEAHVERGSPVPAYQLDAVFEKAVQLVLKFPLAYTYGDGLHNRIIRN